MIKAAVTGNIAAGKSCLEKILASKGFKVLDCDKVNAQLLTADINVISGIKKNFGADAFDTAGGISKQKLGEVVFNKPEKKKLLEDIMQPRIKLQIEKFFDENINEKIVFVSVPLLFEAGWKDIFDIVIFVSADKETRLKRLEKRNGFTKEQAEKRINAQQDEAQKISKSDFVIYNNSGFDELNKQASDVLEKLLEYEP